MLTLNKTWPKPNHKSHKNDPKLYDCPHLFVSILLTGTPTLQMMIIINRNGIAIYLKMIITSQGFLSVTQKIMVIKIRTKMFRVIAI